MDTVLLLLTHSLNVSLQGDFETIGGGIHIYICHICDINIIVLLKFIYILKWFGNQIFFIFFHLFLLVGG